MKHTWQFFRAGGVDQVLIRSGADIAHLEELDQKLWVALACPTRGIEFDSRTLDLIDTDKDGRIRPPEILAACKWAVAQVKDPEILAEGGDSLPIDALANDGTNGPQLAEEAHRIADLLGRADGERITLGDVTDRSKLLAAMRFNGDGVVTVKTSDDPDVQKTIQQILDTQGGVKDYSDVIGVDKAMADAFFAQVDKLRAWHGTVSGDGTIMPLGDATKAAADAVAAVRAKIDDYFTRCRLATYDARAVQALNPSIETYQHLGAQALSLSSQEVADLPLAPVHPGRPLPLSNEINPAWASKLSALKSKAVGPILGETVDALTETAWRTLVDRLEPYVTWTATRPETRLDALSLADIMRIDAEAQAAVLALIDEDARMGPHNARIADLEKLLRFKRDLLHLLNNFVSFSEFYRRKGAIFQAGTLYLDARSCELTVDVADAAKHAQLAGLAKACLAYCTCTRQGQKKTIVAAFTAGDVDFLFVGRNGIFYDRDGKDWDATITKLIENPTSIGQAIFSPYKKFLRMIEEQVAKRAAASDAAAQKHLGALAADVATVDKTKPAATPATPPAPLGFGTKVDVGTVAALGVALGSISAVAVGIFGKFVDLGGWIPVAVIGILVAISGPSVLIAWLKLRQRSLGPILDASGWAINGRMRINVKLGGSLSQTAHVPRNAAHRFNDPFADKHGKAYTIAAVLLLIVALGLAWRLDFLNGVLPASMRHQGEPEPVPVVVRPAARGATPGTVVPSTAAPAAAAPAAAAPAAAASAPATPVTPAAPAAPATPATPATAS
ncbi:hypothetical protein [Pigmentiphaga litoralis]|uniref:EF-hand domain-containing protein n=1 Tax=Pigmentiphaga litoralis TaxID=516702 RepID=A0A7Y9IZ88_9BURK|nr:hypothetical protein [Pigmentiphaga litoralis]NYE26826.1 hypothetical protein [Pigmentiphaga litoralis]NYE85764.1 hypothetical protein [Pigmentiphaga litoralis]